MKTQKLQTKAKAHGTFVSPSSGEILYIDPGHEDERHHSPSLTKDEADEAFRRGLIEDPDGAKEASDDREDEGNTDPNALENVATERTEQTAAIDDEAGGPAGALASRESTAWPDAGRVLGGADDAPADSDEHDDDAPPAPAKRSTTAKPKAKPNEG